VTDRTGLACAFDRAAPGSEVRVGEGDVYLDTTIEVPNFTGTFTGAGRDKTRIHGVDGFVGSSVAKVMWEAWYEPPLPGAPPLLFYFFYDDGWDLSQSGRLTISDLTVFGDAEAQDWMNPYHHSQPSNQMLAMAVENARSEFIGMDAFSKFAQRESAIQLDVAYERIRVAGEERDTEENGLSMDEVMGIYGPITGELRFEGMVFENVMDTFIGGVYDSTIVFGGSAAKKNTYTNIYLTSIVLVTLSGCEIEVSFNEMEHTSGVYLDGFVDDPSNVLVRQNDIAQKPGSGWGGLELWAGGEAGSRSTFVLSENTIHGEDTALWGPIWLWGVQEALVDNNTITGRGPAAIYAGVDYWGGGDVKGVTLRGNNVSGWETTDWDWLDAKAPIWLGWATSECTVIGSGADNVLDEGQENDIVGN